MLTFSDAFCGAGGLSAGFKNAGLRHIVGCEIDVNFAETYRRNIGEVVVGDLQDANIISDFVDRAFISSILIGGPPCQSFSLSGYRDPADPRGRLWRAFFHIVSAMNPLAFLFENVRGIVSAGTLPPEAETSNSAFIVRRHNELLKRAKQRMLFPSETDEYQELKKHLEFAKADLKRHIAPILDSILERGRQLKYRTAAAVLDSSRYGLPQKRQRIFVLGIREDLNIQPSFPPDSDPSVTVRDAIGDLSDKPERFLPNHIFTKHAPEFVKKIENVKPGLSLYNYGDAWFRLEWEKVARTVKENHGGVFLHPDQHRCLTPRELARLQGFADNFTFYGPKSSVLKQIGNAVPPPLSSAVALHLRDLLERNGESEDGKHRGKV